MGHRNMEILTVRLSLAAIRKSGEAFALPLHLHYDTFPCAPVKNDKTNVPVHGRDSFRFPSVFPKTSEIFYKSCTPSIL